MLQDLKRKLEASEAARKADREQVNERERAHAFVLAPFLAGKLIVFGGKSCDLAGNVGAEAGARPAAGQILGRSIYLTSVYQMLCYND